jgi:hypothetical protein
MSILGQEKNSVLGNQGITTPTTTEQQLSKLHNEYSITGNPNIKSKPNPSRLDLGGVAPQVPGKTPYLNNLPK